MSLTNAILYRIPYFGTILVRVDGFVEGDVVGAEVGEVLGLLDGSVVGELLGADVGDLKEYRTIRGNYRYEIS